MVKIFFTILIFIIAFPLSWIAAWQAGSWFTAALSLLMPTYGVIYWALLKVLDHGFIHSLLSWGFGFVGACAAILLMTKIMGKTENTP